MIPRLCDPNQTTIGWLADCVSCQVTEERNGIFEAEFQYPTTGKWFSQIVDGNIVMLPHDDTKVPQPFEIYRRAAPVNGLVTFNAHHISYQLGHCIIKPPFTAQTVSEAFLGFVNSAKTYTACNFTFWTDKTGTGTFSVNVPDSIKAVLGGQSGSILDVFGGGEYKWDNHEVRLYQSRGSDRGVTIRYGKNLLDIDQVSDSSGLYNSVVPYWTDGEKIVVGSMVTVQGASSVICVPMDVSDAFSEEPTAAQVTAKGQARLNASNAWVPDENIKVDFVALWQTEDYKDVANLQRVSLCDLVTVEYPSLGVSAKKKVIRTVYNPLLEKYDEIELGEKQVSFAETIRAQTEEQIKASPGITKSVMQAAIEEATTAITGGAGGNFVIIYDSNGKPTEVAWLDTGDINTAVNVWRWNGAGLAHSSHGYSGPFDDFAILANGAINATRITTGTLNAALITTGTMLADRILGGTMKLGGSGNGNGVLEIYDTSGNRIGRLDNTGANITGDVVLHSDRFYTYIGSHYAYLFLTDFSGFQWANPYALNIYRQDSSNRITSMCVFAESIGSFQESIITNLDRYARAVTLSSSANLDGSTEPTITKRFLETFDSDGYGVRYWKDPDHDYRLNLKKYNVGLMSDDKTAYIDLEGKADYEQFIIRAGDLGFRFGVGVVQITFNGSTWLNLTTSSAKKYKKNIKPISKALDFHKLLDLPVVEFEYRKDADVQYIDLKGQKVPGFLAEDVADIYPAASIHNPQTGELESWDERRIIPGMLALIQEQQKQIDDLTARLEALEAKR